MSYSTTKRHGGNLTTFYYIKEGYIWKGYILYDSNHKWHCVWGFYLFVFLFLLAAPHCLWDLSSPTRDWTWALGSENVESQAVDHQGIPPTIWHSGKGKTLRTVKGSLIVWWYGERGINRHSTEDFQGSKTILCDTIMVDGYHYTFPKTQRICSIKSEP